MAIPIIMTEFGTGKVVAAGYSGATLVKSQALFERLDAQPAPVAPRRGLPAGSSTGRMTTGRMMKALDELQGRIDHMARATKAERVLSHVEAFARSRPRPSADFTARANAGTRASRWA